jgi:hypothetical protein
LTVERWELFDEDLVSPNSSIEVKISNRRSLAIYVTYCLGLVVAERLAKALVEVQGYYRLRQLIKVPPKNIGGIMDSVSSPIKAFTKTIRCVKLVLQFFDTLFRTGKAEYTFDVGC